MIISSQLLRTLPGKGTLTADHAGIISLPTIGIFDQRDSGKFGAGITTSKIITSYVIKANFFRARRDFRLRGGAYVYPSAIRARLAKQRSRDAAHKD